MTKKIIFAIAILIATVAMAEHYERTGVCIPLFGISGTVEGVTYTVETDYIYRPAPFVPVYVPPPPRHHHHRHFAPPPPPPPPPPRWHRPPPPPRHPSKR